MNLDKQLKTNHFQILEMQKRCVDMQETIDWNFDKYCNDLIMEKDREQKAQLQDMNFKIIEFS